MSCVSTNFQIYQNTDNTIQLTLIPVTNVSAWSISFTSWNRFYGISGLISLTTNSGYSNYTSGMSIISSGTGVIGIKIPAAATSGWNPGAFAFSVNRAGSGVSTVLAEGYLLVTV